MLGLFISFLLVFVSSYFITSIFTPKQGKYRNCAFLILLGTMFAQIVLSFEILSLFKTIKSTNVLILNLIFFTASLAVWLKNGKPLYFPDIKTTFKKIWFALKSDKYLMIMSFGLIFFIVVAIFLCIACPIRNYDAMSYHLNRVAFWLSQGSLNHFDITDERNLIMPINSEILYLWVLSFLKNDVGLGFFSLLGYFACVFSVYNILGYFNFTERRKIWSVIILSSFASVIAEASCEETDVLIAGLILASVYLFLVALKEKSLSVIFFSSLMYALAMGTKSPSIIAFPGVFIILAYFAFKQYKKEFYKPLMAFCSLLFLNFMIFSSYNYILNFIAYQDFLGSESSKAVHSFWGGPKGVVANFIRYIFMLFDFSGFRYSEYIGENILNLRTAVFDFLKIPYELGVSVPDENKINNGLVTVKMGAGILGFLLFFPSVLSAIILKLVRKNSQKISAVFIFAVTFLVNIFCLSFSIAYFVFSIRFVMTMILIASPVLAISYSKKNHLLKLTVLFFVMSYFLLMSTNIVTRSLADVIKVYKEEKTIYDARERLRCHMTNDFKGKNSFCCLRDIIKNGIPKGSVIGIIPSHYSRLYTIKMLEHEGYTIEIIMPQKIDTYDFGKFDYIIETNELSVSLLLYEKSKDILAKLKFDEDGNQLIYPNSENKCTYLDYFTNRPVKPQDKVHKIYAAACYVSDEFLYKEGFDRVFAISFRGKMLQDDNDMKIFQNRTKQIKKFDTNFLNK